MNNNLSIEKFFPTLNLIFIAFFSGQIIYLLIGLFIIQNGNMKGIPGLNTIFMFITPVVILFSIFASKFIYSKQVASLDRSSSLESKLVSYRTGNIVKLALLEGANIFNVSVMIITANYFFAALFIIMIGFFFVNKPTKEKFILEFKISAEEALKIIG